MEKQKIFSNTSTKDNKLIGGSPRKYLIIVNYCVFPSLKISKALFLKTAQ